MLALLLVLALAGCGATEIDDPWGVELTVSNVTATGCTYTFTQRGGHPGEDLGYGSQFRLERKNGDGWAEVEEIPAPDGVRRAWTLVLYLIPLGKSVSNEMKWDDLYGELPAGDYRLCKEVQQGRVETMEERMYYAEFAIE